MMFYEAKSVSIREAVLNQVDSERIAQNLKWGKQNHPYTYWLAILMEEVGEVAQAMQEGSAHHKKSDANDLYNELIQVAAVATAIAEQVLRDEN